MKHESRKAIKKIYCKANSNRTTLPGISRVMTIGVVGSVERSIPEPLAGGCPTIIDLFPDYDAFVEKCQKSAY